MLWPRLEEGLFYLVTIPRYYMIHERQTIHERSCRWRAMVLIFASNTAKAYRVSAKNKIFAFREFLSYAASTVSHKAALCRKVK